MRNSAAAAEFTTFSTAIDPDPALRALWVISMQGEALQHRNSTTRAR
jgi:hypothetical protein